MAPGSVAMAGSHTSSRCSGEAAKHSTANLDLVGAWKATLGPPSESEVASGIGVYWRLGKDVASSTPQQMASLFPPNFA